MGLFSSRNRGDNTSTDSGRDRKTESGSDQAPADAKPTQSWSTRPVSARSDSSADSQAEAATAAGETTGTSSRAQTRSEGDKRMATIGQSIIFKGELSGDEDLEIEGNVDGNVNLANHQLTVGANGRLKAEIVAKSIIVIGQVIGNLTATERIEVQATGVVEGDLKAPRLNVQEGAVLNGSIDMSAPSAADVKKPAQPAQPQAAANPAGDPALKTA